MGRYGALRNFRSALVTGSVLSETVSVSATTPAAAATSLPAHHDRQGSCLRAFLTRGLYSDAGTPAGRPKGPLGRDRASFL